MVNDDIKNASKTIKNGGIVLFPTETVYGIAYYNIVFDSFFIN